MSGGGVSNEKKGIFQLVFFHDTTAFASTPTLTQFPFNFVCVLDTCVSAMIPNCWR